MRLWIIAGASLVLGSSPGWSATPFDGAWTVYQACPTTGQGVQGYSWVYGATVTDGVLVGEHTPSSPQDGSLHLTGRIDPDGSALMSATGQTGRSEYSIGHVAPGYPIHFGFPAHFTASKGNGTRVEQRVCEFTFTRR